MMWLCFFFHKWGKWTQTKDAVDGEAGVDIQFRVCQRCNYFIWELL